MATIPLDKANDIQETSSHQLSAINYRKILSYSNENFDLKTLPLIYCDHTLTFEN